MLKRIKEFKVVAPVGSGRSLVLENSMDRTIKNGLKSKFVFEKDFERTFRKHAAKWRKYYSE